MYPYCFHSFILVNSQLNGLKLSQRSDKDIVVKGRITVNKKQIPALIAALVMTLVVGTGLLALGLDALFPHTVAASSAAPASQAALNTADVQKLLDEYKAREAKYDTQLKDAAKRISQDEQMLAQASRQVRAYQSVLMQLQQQGIITVTRDGRIFVNQAQNGGTH